MVEDFRVGLKTRVFNFNLWTAFNDIGRTRQEIARDLGVSWGTLNDYVRFKRYPNEERKIKMALYLGVTVDNIFPEEIQDIRIEHQPPAMSFTRQEAMVAGFLPSDDGDIEALEDNLQRDANAALVRSAMDSLNPREKRVLEERFGMDGEDTKTLVEVGRLFGVTPERVRQIERKALRKLRHPKNSKKLKEALDGGEAKSNGTAPANTIQGRTVNGVEMKFDDNPYCYCGHSVLEHEHQAMHCWFCSCAMVHLMRAARGA
jgi:RNA polymerase sigma factor (sigma-70 family)